MNVLHQALDFASRLNIFARSRQRRDHGRRVVYTCLFGYSEQFNDLVYERDDSIDFVCFTDMPELQSNFWRIEQVDRGKLDPSRAAKQYKILPHRFLREYSASLYIDNTVRLKVTPAEIFNRYLCESRSPLVCFRHPWRECVYDEAREVLALGFDKPELVEAQMVYYRSLNYPQRNGLWKGAFLLRRHHDRRLVRVMETWFKLVCEYSQRDQLSFPVAAWLHRFQPQFIPEDFMNNDLLEYPFPPNPLRLPRGFDDELYLQLNPDVRAANMNPRKHYLSSGAAEGRRFR